MYKIAADEIRIAACRYHYTAQHVPTVLPGAARPRTTGGASSGYTPDVGCFMWNTVGW